MYFRLIVLLRKGSIRLFSICKGKMNGRRPPLHMDAGYYPLLRKPIKLKRYETEEHKELGNS